MSPNQAREAWAAIDDALELQHRNLAELPILTSDWQHRRGRISIIMGGPESQLDGDRLIRMINERVLVNGSRLRATWNHQLPRVARLTVRAGIRGNAEDLIEDDGIGIVRLNRWPAHLRGQVRYLGTIPSEDDTNYRLIRFEASPAIVQLIQEANGTMFIGRYHGTVQSGKRPVKMGSTINYVLQK